MKSVRSNEIRGFLNALATKGYLNVSVEGGPLSHWKQADADGLSRLLESEPGWIFEAEGFAAALQICRERWITTLARGLLHPEVMIGNHLYEVHTIRKGPEGILVRLMAQNGQEKDYTLDEIGFTSCGPKARRSTRSCPQNTVEFALNHEVYGGAT